LKKHDIILTTPGIYGKLMFLPVITAGLIVAEIELESEDEPFENPIG
jgi:CYTH domain-containing protein